MWGSASRGCQGSGGGPASGKEEKPEVTPGPPGPPFPTRSWLLGLWPEAGGTTFSVASTAPKQRALALQRPSYTGPAVTSTIPAKHPLPGPPSLSPGTLLSCLSLQGGAPPTPCKRPSPGASGGVRSSRWSSKQLCCSAWIKRSLASPARLGGQGSGFSRCPRLSPVSDARQGPRRPPCRRGQRQHK